MLAERKFNVVAFPVWGVRRAIRIDQMRPGRIKAYVSPGVQDVELSGRSGKDETHGLQITYAALMIDNRIDETAEKVVSLREATQEWLCERRSTGRALGDYTLDGFTATVAGTEPLIEQFMVENNVFATFLTPSYSLNSC